MAKRIPTLLLLIAPYAYVAIIANLGFSIEMMILWPVLFALILLPNMLYAFVLPRLGFGGRRLLFWCMVLKLCNIPVYLGVFLIGMMTAPFAGMVLPLLFLFDVSLLLPSSMYGLSGILRARREGCLSVRAAAVCAVLMFLFCLDVFSAVFCYLQVRRAGRTPSGQPTRA